MCKFQIVRMIINPYLFYYLDYTDRKEKWDKFLPGDVNAPRRACFTFDG